MFAAGTVGIFSDLVMAVGALLVALELARRGRSPGAEEASQSPAGSPSF